MYIENIGIDMMKIMKILIMFMMLIYGLSVINDWVEHQRLYKEGNTIEEIGLDNLSEGDYVSFYINDYANKEIYIEGNVEYEIYTILLEHNTSSNKNSYIQIMVKDWETKQKFKNIGESKVYFQGEVLGDSYGEFGFGKEWETGVPEGMDIEYSELVCNWAIREMELPSRGYGLFFGIGLVILSIVTYRMFGGMQSFVPDIEIKSHKYEKYEFEFYPQIYNINNELLFEKDNLKRLKLEQIESKKVDNFMTAMFCVGLLLLCSGNVMEFLSSIVLENVVYRSFLMVMVVILKIIGIILTLISIGGVWSRFINSSYKLAVYIAYKRGKRSIYIEIEKCKQNIEYLERIIEEKNL